MACVNASRRASSIDDFKHILELLGYKVAWEENKKYITFTTPEGQKCRNRKMYPKYLFTKEVLEKQFNENKAKYTQEELNRFQNQFVDKVKSQSTRYPLSHIVYGEKNNRILDYETWYQYNKEYMLDDDKYAMYRTIGFVLKYAIDENDFKERLLKSGMDAEIDRENDIDMLIGFVRLFGNYDKTPITSAMSIVGSDLNGEKLKDFMYYFERGSASRYNKNLNNDLSM